jgi:MFS family permease
MSSNSHYWYSTIFPGPISAIGLSGANRTEYKSISEIEASTEVSEESVRLLDENTPILSTKKATYNNKDGSESHGSVMDLISMRIAEKYVDEYSAMNAGIFTSYLAIGILSKVNQTPVQYYLIQHLHASSAQYSAYTTLHRLPWSMKLIFGMLSDGIPILSYRRKSWLSIGWFFYSFSALILSSFGSPGIDTTVFMVFLITCFLVMADVCTDTLCVERSKLEPESKRGSFQTIGFIYRAFGRIIGAVLGTYLYDNGTTWSYDISQIFFLSAMIPIFTLVFFFWGLVELSTSSIIPTFQEQLMEIWRVLQLEAVWKPVIFIYSFNVMQINNPAWSNFLVYGLGFNDAKLGYLLIFSAIISFLVRSM